MTNTFDKSKNAYLVLAHEDVAMLNILVSRLLNTGSVWIHIDKSSPIKIEEVTVNKDVHVLKEIKVYWGGFSMVKATMLLANTAIEFGANRITLLSGLSFPVVDDAELAEVANSNQDIFEAGMVDLESIGEPFRSRFTKKHFAFHLGSGLHTRIIRKHLEDFGI